MKYLIVLLIALLPKFVLGNELIEEIIELTEVKIQFEQSVSKFMEKISTFDNTNISEADFLALQFNTDLDLLKDKYLSWEDTKTIIASYYEHEFTREELEYHRDFLKGKHVDQALEKIAKQEEELGNRLAANFSVFVEEHKKLSEEYQENLKVLIEQLDEPSKNEY